MHIGARGIGATWEHWQKSNSSVMLFSDLEVDCTNNTICLKSDSLA